MEEGDSGFREKEMVEEEGPVISGDDSNDEHQMFDEMPVRVRQFYFVKHLPVENPKTDAIIKKAEETIDKLNRDQVVMASKIRERMMDRDEVDSKLRRISYYETNELTLKWQREKLDILHLSLDKLAFANNAYKGKPINTCLSGGEVDKRKLSFLMVHGCKNMADERKLLREVNASQGKDGGMTIDELHAPIQRLQQKLCFNYWGYKKTDDDLAREKAILKDIKQHELARERTIADAVVNGKLWNSLGSKKAIQAEVLNKRLDGLREEQVQVNGKIRKVKKELERVEKDICSLQQRFKDANRKKDEAYDTILRLKKQYGEENACYYQYRSLMKKIKVLAEKKDIAAIHESSQEQVEKFMQKWNNSQDFRDDYEKRVVPSLNSRHLEIDGRMIANQKPQGDDNTRKVIKPEALSKTRLKWLMKEAEDPSELLSR
ncbi:proton pump-interactor 1-like isoform X2 [Momordica charantia]|uniref:Proton pump-interactor 1-like isoform X2 n=1 Tax=Momordica charantia TaxID=3673 RepID=A0A6J1DPC7_MOMCH|nr:proton pump-interactor 1-like isoform X2 [Momordica charantia]